MARLILTLICVMLPSAVQANTIYKCRKDDKIVFSQTACPQEFSQHKIEYQLGITTEVDSDKRDIPVDPLQALLNRQTISKENYCNYSMARSIGLNRRTAILKSCAPVNYRN